MLICPNKSHKQFKKMVNELGEARAHYHFMLNNNDFLTDKQINDVKNSSYKYNSNEVVYDFTVVNRIIDNYNYFNKLFNQFKNKKDFFNKLKDAKFGIPKDQIFILESIYIDNMSFDNLILEFINEYSYTVDINITKQSHYSNLTVPGGTNGSYIEANIETPMIIPSIQSHAQFKTENTIGWMRADEKQNYQEKDIDNLIEIMKKSGILEVNCK